MVSLGSWRLPWTKGAAASRQQVTGGFICNALPGHRSVELVQAVKSRLAKEHASLPLGKYGRDNDELLLWFLRDRKFDAEAAVSKVAKFLEWRRDFGIESITESSLAEMKCSGKAYLHKCPDNQGRPVLVIVARNHFSGEDVLANKKLCVYLLEKALDQLPPGQEQILGVFDLRGFGLRNADFDFVKFFIDVFHYYYPKRLAQVLFVEAPILFQPGWQLLRPLLKSYASLARFCSLECVQQEYFTEETLPPDFRS